MYKQRLELVKANYNMALGEKKKIESDIKKDSIAITSMEIISLQETEVLNLLNLVSNQAREKAKVQLETVVTEALKYISDGDYEFQIDMLDRGKPQCEFYVVSHFNGVESKQRPQDACGGGFVDIISTALRYVYLNAFSSPIINNAAILDEPGKMISEIASVRFAEFIKFLGTSFDRQTIMITHNDSLLNIGDKNYVVNNVNGISHADDTVYDVDNLEALFDV